MKTLKFLLVGAIALMAFVGCSDDVEELVVPDQGNNQNQGNNQESEHDETYYAEHASISCSDPKFTVTDDGMIVSFKVSGGEVVVDVDCGTEWTAQNSAEDIFGCSIDSTSVTITAEQNLVEAELTGTITLVTKLSQIEFASITVTQNAYGAPEITVDANEWHVPAVGELTTEIVVESTDEWTVEGGDEWLTVEKSGTGLNLTVEENEDTEERITKIVLTCTDGYNSDSETIIVTQDGLAYITLSEESLEFDSNGGEAVVTVESNFEWEYVCESEWLSIEKDEEDGSLKITCDATEVEEDRESILTFTAGDGASNTIEVGLPIAQGAYLMPKITAETEEWNAPAIGELTTEIGVEANFEWTFDVNADWLTAGKTENGVTLTAKENTETIERSGEVVLSCTDGIKTVSDTIAVTQDGLAYISLSEEELLLSTYSGNATVNVESNYEWNCICDADWFTVTKSEIENSLTIKYDTNWTSTSRETVITFTAGDGVANVAEIVLKVIQNPYAPEDALILEYTVTQSNASVYLPIASVASVTIDWDDGTTTVDASSHPHHTYSTPGIYTVTINGQIGELAYMRQSSSSGKETRYDGYLYLSSVIQWGNTGLTNMKYAFYDCSNLKSLPEGAGPFSNVTTFFGAFMSCESLTTIPENLFSNCTVAADFSYCFWGADSLIAAPSFEGCSAVTTFFYAFGFCKSLTAVPENMFSGCTAVTSFEMTFYGCSSLTSAPSFEGCSATTTFRDTFNGCTSLKTVPENMFSGCTAVTSFERTFYNCTSLTSAPSFKGCLAPASFGSTFDGCSALKTVPENMFSGCTAIKSFYRTFYNCFSLTSVPSFAGCSSATTFEETFYECSALTTVSENTFLGCNSAETFAHTFYNCSSLVSAPSFEGCSAASSFEECFRGCTALTIVPENIFSGVSAVTTFKNTFSECSALVSAPSFEGCSSATEFYGTFYNCAKLVSLPENMFSDCDAITTIQYAFYGCSALKTVPVSLFDNLRHITEFRYAFHGCSSVVGESPFTEIEVDGQNVKAHLYERGDYAIYLRCDSPKYYSDCFTGSSFSDIDSIPSSWGGNGN